jgi:transposase InsO family protein
MKNPSPYLKMQVLGAIEFAEGRTIRERIRRVSQTTFHDEEDRPYRFTWRTIETWLYRYKLHGVTALEPKGRSDKGKPRKVSPEQVQEAIDQVLPSFRTGGATTKAQIYRACIERGLLRREQIAPNTFRRIVHGFGMLEPAAETTNKKRLAFSKLYANQMWQADTMFGPFVTNGRRPVQTKLICFLDDASRVVCHGEFFFNENTDSLTRALRSALYKRGVPEVIYVDNGSIYTSKEITLVCSRMGCVLAHAPIRDGAAKGKIERLFRNVRESFLCRELDLSSLAALNRQFIGWVEDEYNNRTHSAIGMKPVDRFGLNLDRIRFLPPNEITDELFFFEEDRHVKKDNTLSLKSRRYQAPRDVRGRTVQIRFDRQRCDRVIVYHKGERLGEATLLDRVANDRAPKAAKSGDSNPVGTGGAS